MKYYHVSRNRLRVGERLYPTSWWGQYGVFMSPDPNPHFTIWEMASISSDRWVYEVEPIGKVRKGEWSDLVAPGAIVLRFVGNARGIALNATRRYRDKPNSCMNPRGSCIHRRP